MLAQIMHEAAEEARKSNRAATERFFRQLKQDAEKKYSHVVAKKCQLFSDIDYTFFQRIN